MRKNSIKVIETIDYLATEMPLKTACRVMGILTNQYYRWKNKIYCTASTLNLCFKSHPNQLTIAESTTIKDAINDPENYRKKLSTIWYKLMRDGKLFCSRASIYKYAKMLKEPLKIYKANNEIKSIISSRVFEYIHIDTTFLSTTDDGMVRGVIIKDNYSKFILHKGTVPNGESKWIAKLLEQMYLKYNLLNHTSEITIVSDGGSENKGDVINWIDQMDNTLVKKVIAKSACFKFTNNDIESTFNLFKNMHLKGITLRNSLGVDFELNRFEFENNNNWFPNDFYGISPMEVFNGEPIIKNRFQLQIKEAAKNRHLVNRLGKFCGMCS